MRAVVFERHGGLEVLKPMEVPDPEVAAGGVRVRVRACALNRLDLFVRQGWKGLDLEMPHILGSDVAGVVDAVGPEVTGVQVGDDVVLGPGLGCGRCGACLSGFDNRCRGYAILGEHVRGGYAELVSVPARNVFKKPKLLSFAQAAALPLVFTTAWGMLVERARVKPGDVVLVHAAGSGVGSAAIQIARLFGATVLATASTAEKLERALALGAHHGINYTTENFRARVREITEKRGADIVIEHTGGATFQDSLLSLTTGGVLVTCGATAEPETRIDIRHLFTRHLSVFGQTMGSLSAMLPILAHAEAGKLKPVLDRTLPLVEARRAQEILLERAQFGKVVLEP